MRYLSLAWVVRQIILVTVFGIILIGAIAYAQLPENEEPLKAESLVKLCDGLMRASTGDVSASDGFNQVFYCLGFLEATEEWINNFSDYHLQEGVTKKLLPTFEQYVSAHPESKRLLAGRVMLKAFYGRRVGSACFPYPSCDGYWFT